MKTVWILVMLAVFPGFITEAHARYFISATCTSGTYESQGAWSTYEGCRANVEALERGPDGPRCSFSCVIEGSAGERAVNMGTQVATGVADVFKGPALRTYNTERKGYPWGRSVIVVDVTPLGVGLDDGKPRFALGPGTINLRILPWVSAGVFGGFLFPARGGAGHDSTDVKIGGANLRLALKGKHMDFKDRGDRSAYYELYLDAGYGTAVPSCCAYEGGTGRAYSAALGINITTAWIFGFGLSTRFTAGRIKDSTDLVAGGVTDLDIKSWDILMAHILVLGI